MALKIGQTQNGKAFTLPPDAVTQTFAALARRGAGKTNLAVVMAEEMLDARAVIVALDPIGVWHGLRSSYDGKEKGYEILILGGEHGDLPLDPHAGKAIAEFLVADRVPTILDVSAFGENEMRRFVGEFAQRFYQINREPVHWFVDEADEFAPQQGSGAEIARCLGAMQNIVRRGRARGIGVTLITQRSAVLNKSVLTQTECLVAMQTTAPQDMDAIKGWLQYHAGKAEVETILSTLPKFQRGEAWVYSPGWLKSLTRIQVRRRTTFDSSATPKAGEKRSEPKTVAQIDLGKLGARIKAASETAKANDPRELRKQVADLRAQVAKLENAKPEAKVETRTVEKSVFRKGEIEAAVKLAERVADIVAKMQAAAGLIERASMNIKSEPSLVLSPLQSAWKKNPPVAAAPLRKPQPRERQADSNGDLKGPHRRILNALAWWEAFGVNCPTREQVAFIAKYSPSSGGFNNPCGQLNSNGLIHYPIQGRIQLTDAGRKDAEQPDVVPSFDGLCDAVRAILAGPETKIFNALVECETILTREQLAEATGYSPNSGGFNNPCGRLRTLGVIDYPTQGQVALSDLIEGFRGR